MKKILLALLFLPCIAMAQTKKTVHSATATAHHQSAGMDGLGRFKINKTTTAVIDDLCKELDVPLQHGYSMMRLAGLDDSIAVMEVDYQSRDEFPDASQFSNGCAGYRAVYLPNYTIADIALKGIVLKFYNNVLIGIQVENPSTLAEAFAVKYGKPALKVTRTPKVCLFTNTGNKVTYQDESFYSTWYNGSVTANSTTAKYYDSHCTEQYLSFFTIEDEHKLATVEACGRVVEKNAQAKGLKAKKQKLSDL
jgi:hypothetical protein